MKKFTPFILIAVFLLLSPEAQTEENTPTDSKGGVFLEIGGFGSFPVAGGEGASGIAAFSPDPRDLKVGGGGYISGGYESQYFAIGPKIMESIFGVSQAFDDGRTYWTSILLHTKIFPFQFFNVSTGPVKVYALVDGGLGLLLQGASGQSDLKVPTGFDLNTGAGVRWLFSKRAYTSLEATYHGIFAGTSCNDFQRSCIEGNIHAINTTLNFGLLF